MAIRYKKFGNQEYVYEIWNVKDSESGKWLQRSKYLGVVVDKENGKYEKRNKIRQEQMKKKQKCRYISVMLPET